MSEQKILVVDDDQRLRELLNRYLDEQGFSVRTADGGPAMDRLLSRERFDLIGLAAVLVHFGNLAPVLAGARQALRENGGLAFTVLTHAGSGVVLDETSFFRHGQDHVEEALRQAGFTPLLIEEGVHEVHDGQPVMGLAVGARPRE